MSGWCWVLSLIEKHGLIGQFTRVAPFCAKMFLKFSFCISPSNMIHIWLINCICVSARTRYFCKEMWASWFEKYCIYGVSNSHNFTQVNTIRWAYLVIEWFMPLLRQAEKQILHSCEFSKKYLVLILNLLIGSGHCLLTFDTYMYPLFFTVSSSVRLLQFMV